MIKDESTSINPSDARCTKNVTWIDVRCPREYKKGHFSNAINIPLFSNIEYEEIGKLYKASGKEASYELGLKYLKLSKKNILDQLSKLKTKNMIIYCARGGLRSKGFEKICIDEGYKVERINNGYKGIRKHVLNSFKVNQKIIIVAGSTGTGKTSLLHKMKKQGLNIIDLEKLANHRGSAFGDVGLSEQPTQQQFENNLSVDWSSINKNSIVYIESESRKIGKVVIPESIWNQMQLGFYLKINMNIKRRIKNLVNDYGIYSKEIIENRINRISKKLGGQHTKKAINLLYDGRLADLCKLLLNNYYDKMYAIAYKNRQSLKATISISNESENEIIKRILKNHE